MPMNKNKQEIFNGFLIVNKPENSSSFDCIRYIKKIIKQKVKIGHTGTLDNFATGLLILCIGRTSTRFSGHLLQLNKEYIVTAQLGKLTDTLDKTGKIIEQKEINAVTKKDLENAIEQLGKSYIQIPPIYSALKYKGTPLYKLARQKKLDIQTLTNITKQKSRHVRIYDIELLAYKPPFFTVKTTVSKGTYIRSLANDISQMLKIPATTYKLQRTKIGPIPLQNAIDLEKIKNLKTIKENLITIEYVKNFLKN